MRRQVQVPHDEPSTSGRRERLVAQIRRLLRGGACLIEVSARRKIRDTFGSKILVAEDGCEQVVEVVRDAASEEPQALELMRPPKAEFHLQAMRLCPLPLRHVTQDDDVRTVAEIVATVTTPSAVKAIPPCLGLPARPPPVAPAPDREQGTFEFDGGGSCDG